MAENHNQSVYSRRRCPFSPCETKPRTDSALSLTSHQPDILGDKANALNKVTVPIKEYSNKFFR
jgi:hypothetical protein